MKRFFSVLVMVVFFGTAFAQLPAPSTTSIDPAYYFHQIDLVTDSGRIAIVSKEYTQFSAIPANDKVLGTFALGTVQAVEVKGAHPHLGFRWEKQECRVGSDSISIDLFTKIDPMGAYPEAIDPFEFSFPVTTLTPGTYHLRLCNKQLGTVIIK